MKAITVTYQRVFNLGNYESERVEITLQVEEGETAEQVLAAAKRFVNGEPVKVPGSGIPVMARPTDLPF